MQKDQLEQDILYANKDKSEILEQLQNTHRQKNTLAEDLLMAKKDIERLNENQTRLTRDKEELNKERNNFVVDLTAAERENRALSEVNASLKSDKESLEASLYEAQQQIAQLEARKEQLEVENQELLIRKENTQAEVNRLHKDLELEIEKAARQRDSLNQRYIILEQESSVSQKHRPRSRTFIDFFLVRLSIRKKIATRVSFGA